MPKLKTHGKADLVSNLGPLAFASRLRRLADRLHRDVSRYYHSQSLDFEARWFPLLYMLKNRPSMAVTDLAEALGLTHPAINQIAGDMGRHGLIACDRDKQDERRHLLRLTPKARQLLTEIEPIWADVSTATAALIAETDHDLLAALDSMEQQLNAVDMFQRLEAIQKRRGVNGLAQNSYKHSRPAGTKANTKILKK